jgi:hypothetical protein
MSNWTFSRVCISYILKHIPLSYFFSIFILYLSLLLEENILLHSYCAVYSGQISHYSGIFVSVCTVLTVVLEVFCAVGMPVYSNPLLGSLLLLHEFIHPPLTCLLSDFILGHNFFPYLYFSFALRFLLDQSVMCVGSKRKFVTCQFNNLSFEMCPSRHTHTPPSHALCG